MTIKITWIKNPPAQVTVTDRISISSATSEGWIIDQGQTAPVNSLFSALEIVPIKNIEITPENPSTNADTNYNVIFTADTDVPKNSYVLITLPTEITVSATNTGGATKLNTCGNIFTATAGLTCTVGTNTSGKTTIKVEGIFPETTNSGQFGVKVGLLKNPGTPGDTSSFKIEIFSPAGNPIASKDIDTPVKIKDPIPEGSCDVKCKTCSGTTTSCDSCKVPSDNPFLQGNSCVSACSSGYFLKDTTCYACHHS